MTKPEAKSVRDWVILPNNYQPDTLDTRIDSGLDYSKYFHESVLAAAQSHIEQLESEINRLESMLDVWKENKK